MPSLLKFADSEYTYDDAYFVIFGVPFDGTTSFRGGARFAPNAIREASINLESFIYDNKFLLKNAKIHDMGNLDEHGKVEDVVDDTKFTIEKLLDEKKFPIMLGGEHSITIGSAKALKNYDYAILFIDAHSDFRSEYLDVEFSHACVSRRAFEYLGKERIASIGVRSVSPEEFNDEYFKDFYHLSAKFVHENGIEKSLDMVLDRLNGRNIYLSIDMDGLDPSFAPGVATPEPFGLTTWDLRYIINNIGKRLIGADIVEISPPFDNGNTSMLAARLVQEIISSKNVF
ncbi:MAG: agmatinase [Thermoplasmata archaeon]|nr:agmatinase [Thermoplasmata archaeon]